MIRAHRVAAAGVELAVTERGDRTHPAVLLIHGYPDTSAVWDPVAERLAARCWVIAYDVRGAGGSTAPAAVEAYDLDRLADDTVAVLDAIAPGRAVHVVGHDWGSMQAWHLAVHGRLGTRLASLTSMGAPGLDHVGHWLRDRVRAGALGEIAVQSTRSWYMTALRVPGVAAALWPRLAHRWPALLASREGVPVGDGYPAATIAGDGVHGARLYQRNLRRRVARPHPDPRVDVPVQLLVLGRDRFVSPRLFDQLPRWASRLRRRSLDAGHWAPRSHPDEVAAAIATWIDDVERGAVPPARRPRQGQLGGQLVVVTGAARGIGRSTALAFAAAGAAIVAVDLDAAGAARTAAEAIAAGAEAHHYAADVADPTAMTALADTIEARHGDVDVIVNNAGIAVSGPFLATELDDWRRVLDVNLWGVIHGCRAFGRRMAARGSGAIVNVASAAAFAPSRALPAYSTSKAAVLMLTECLRAELADQGVAVIAICPGLIETDITRVARFAGVSDDEQDRLRARTSAIYHRRGFSPDRVAAAILRAVRDNAAVVPVTAEAHALRLLSRAAPALVRRLARFATDGR